MHTYNRRIIVVDDVNEFVQREETLLRREELSLLTVSSGAEALFKAQHEKPDLMILNFFMPDLNGFKVCSKLKSDSATEGIPVLIIAAHSDEDDDPTDVSEIAGCDGCITKPIHKDDFIPLVQECLEVPPRRHLRSDVSLLCSITDEDGQRGATIVNLTSHGLGLEAEPAPWAGDIVKVDMSVENEPVTFQVAVRWSTETGAGGPGRAGAEFLAVPAELLSLL
jgi:CheY-like chemotaxis protein